MISEERLREVGHASGFGSLYPDAVRFARAVEREATAELRAENERLRGLLREAEPWLRPDEHSPPELDALHARVVALAGKKP